MLNALNVNVNVERTRLTTHRIYSRVSRRLNEVPSYPLYIQSSPSVGTVLGDFFVHAQGDKTLRGGEHNKTPQAGTPALGGPPGMVLVEVDRSYWSWRGVGPVLRSVWPGGGSTHVVGWC